MVKNLGSLSREELERICVNLMSRMMSVKEDTTDKNKLFVALQRVANEQKEQVYIIEKPESSKWGGIPTIPYGVLKSQSNEYEQVNKIRVLEPQIQ